MIVEFTGISGVGKTVLSNCVINRLSERGVDVVGIHAEHFPLGGLLLRNLTNPTLQHVIFDLLSLVQLVSLPASQRDFLGFSWRMLCRYGESPWVKVNYFRNIIRMVGTDQWLRRRVGPDQLVVVDEGLMHTAHPIFVHLGIVPDLADVLQYASLVSLADCIVYVKAPLDVVVKRTLSRPDPPLTGKSATQLIEFVSLAYSLFDTVFAQKNILEKTLCVQVGEGEEAIHRTCEYIVSHLVENWRLK